mmetsp:Transcript_93217/g.240902  ORF Transcript_93217/g.240902 Transcript_93217/m.240902 type:complete len:254 (-) Transcript_93217:51-812(-)
MSCLQCGRAAYQGIRQCIMHRGTMASCSIANALRACRLASRKHATPAPVDAVHEPIRCPIACAGSQTSACTGSAVPRLCCDSSWSAPPDARPRPCCARNDGQPATCARWALGSAFRRPTRGRPGSPCPCWVPCPSRPTEPPRRPHRRRLRRRCSRCSCTGRPRGRSSTQTEGPATSRTACSRRPRSRRRDAGGLGQSCPGRSAVRRQRPLRGGSAPSAARWACATAGARRCRCRRREPRRTWTSRESTGLART